MLDPDGAFGLYENWCLNAAASSVAARRRATLRTTGELMGQRVMTAGKAGVSPVAGGTAWSSAQSFVGGPPR